MSAGPPLPRPRHVKIDTTVYSIRSDGMHHDLGRLDLRALDVPVITDHDQRMISLHPDLAHELATRALFGEIVNACLLLSQPGRLADRLLEVLRDNPRLTEWLTA